MHWNRAAAGSSSHSRDRACLRLPTDFYREHGPSELWRGFGRWLLCAGGGRRRQLQPETLPDDNQGRASPCRSRQKIARGRRRDHGLSGGFNSIIGSGASGASRCRMRSTRSRQGAETGARRNSAGCRSLRQGRELRNFSVLQDEGRTLSAPHSETSDARAIRYCSRAGVKRSSLIEKNSSPDKQIRTPEALLPGKEGHHANTGRQRPKTELEARVGIEPTHKGFADLSLTTWVPRPEQEILRQTGTADQRGMRSVQVGAGDGT